MVVNIKLDYWLVLTVHSKTVMHFDFLLSNLDISGN